MVALRWSVAVSGPHTRVGEATSRSLRERVVVLVSLHRGLAGLDDESGDEIELP